MRHKVTSTKFDKISTEEQIELFNNLINNSFEVIPKELVRDTLAIHPEFLGILDDMSKGLPTDNFYLSKPAFSIKKAKSNLN